jgi:hypothetical protein
MTEPVLFRFGNQDGIGLNLSPFNIHFVVWEKSLMDDVGLSMGGSDIIINKRMLVDDPYASEVEMILTEQETIMLGHKASGQNLHWSLFMINSSNEVFPLQVSNTGNRVGTIIVDMVGGVPIAELIRTPMA